MKRVIVVGAISLLVGALSGLGTAGAATANPAVTLASLTIKTVVNNSGHGVLAPDSFVYHVTDTTDGTDVLDGIFKHSGITVVKLPPGTYSVSEEALGEYVEHVSGCADITISVAHPKSCSITNTWTASTILVSTTVDNTAGGTADSSFFHFKVIDTSDNSIAKTGTFDASGQTKIRLPDGTYTITEYAAYGYKEDVSACAGIAIDLADPGACIIANKYDPNSTTTAPDTSSAGSTQVSVHGSVTNTTSCILTLQPALQAASTTDLTTKLSTDAFAQPHKGDPIKLSNTKITVATPASLLQTGVALGIIHNGDSIPESGKLVLRGVGTKETSHTYSFKVTLKIKVVNGNAQPLVASAVLPDTTWTPNNAVDPVFFSEQSLKIASTINSSVTGSVTSVFTCTTPNAPTLIALSAQGSAPPTGGPGVTAAGGGETVGAGGGGGSGGAAGGTGGGILPVTGTSVWLWLAPAMIFIYLGLLALGATARRRRRVLD